LGARLQEAVFVEAGQLFAQLRGGGHHEVVQGGVSLGAGSDRTCAGDAQHAHHFRGAVGALGLTEGFTGQHDRGGPGRVGVIGFAVAGAALPFGAADLGNGDALGAQVAREARAVVARAFDTDRDEL
jgi:hypothetical protein